MMQNDMFSAQSLPSNEDRQETKVDYFDVNSLFIDTKKFCANNGLTEQIFVSDIECEDGFDLINKDLREKVRKFNNSIFYLRNSLYSYIHYCKLWSESDEETNKLLLNVWQRYEARCVCCEIFMYVEKVKSLVRSILNLDPKKTEKNSDFMNALKECALSNNHVKEFYDEAERYKINSSVRFINKVRNDEIHNESCLDNYTDRMEINHGQYLTINFTHAIQNNELYNKIKNCLEALLRLKQNLQKIIDNFVVE